MSRADVNAKIAAITACQYALITGRQAMDAGLSRAAIKRRVATGEWTPVRRGVFRVTAAPKSWRQDLLAAVLAAGDGAVAGGLSAAAFWNVPGFPAAPIEVRSQYGKSRRHLQQGPAQSCLLLPHHCTVVDHIPVTKPTRTVFDIVALVNQPAPSGRSTMRSPCT